jgi:hypothetical protein
MPNRPTYDPGTDLGASAPAARLAAEIEVWSDGVLVGTAPRLNFVGLTVSVDSASRAIVVEDTGGGGGGDADPHASSHEAGGDDELSVDGLAGELADPQLVEVAAEGVLVGTRDRINFVEGSGIAITVTDDGGGGKVDVEIEATGGGGTKVYVGTYADRGTVVASPATGDIYQTTDGPYYLRYNGSTWDHYHRIFGAVTPPAIGSLTWVNQGTCAYTEPGGALRLTETALSGTDRVRILVEALPAAPWTVEIRFRPIALNVNYLLSGIVLRESGTGKLVTHGVRGQAVIVDYWTSPTVFASGPHLNLALQSTVEGLKIYDDGTNRRFYVSEDGFSGWTLVYSTTRTTHITPDQAGIFLSSNNATYLGSTCFTHLDVRSGA